MKTQKFYPFLDGLRCFAILWVIIHHICVNFTTPGADGLIVGTWVFKFFWTGHYGVDLFFVISGFLITGLIFGKDIGKATIKRFYIRRFFKIVPSYALVLACMYFFYLLCDPHNLDSFTRILPRYLVFTQNLYPDNSTMLAHLWSIAVEDHFYLFHPLLVALAYRVAGGRVNVLIMLTCLFGVLLICNGSRFYMQTHFHALPAQNTFLRADGIAFGCMIKLLEDKIVLLPNPMHMTAALALAVSIGIWQYLISHSEEVAWYSYTLPYIASGLLIISCLLGRSILTRFLEYELFRSIGKISYNLYLWHYPLIFVSFYIFKGTPQVILPFYLFAVFFIGWLSTRTVERYFLVLRDRIAP